MTAEERVKLTIGNLVVTNHVLEAEVERLKAELEEAKRGTVPQVEEG